MEEKKENPGPFVRFFGDIAISRVLDFLGVHRRFDYSLSDIARNSGISKMTLFRMWPNLEKYNVVMLTRKIGKAKLYKLNEESQIAKTLVKLGMDIATLDAEKITIEESKKEA
jgi:AraC-like DNA-binding protein